MAVLIPLAHVGHWLWVLYLPPVLIVVGSLLRTKLRERREQTLHPSAGGTGEGGRGQPVDCPQGPLSRDRTRDQKP
jgi:hypothetical protein